MSSAICSKMDQSKILSFSDHQILDSSELKEFAENNFIFDENGKEFS